MQLIYVFFAKIEYHFVIIFAIILKVNKFRSIVRLYHTILMSIRTERKNKLFNSFDHYEASCTTDTWTKGNCVYRIIDYVKELNLRWFVMVAIHVFCLFMVAFKSKKYLCRIFLKGLIQNLKIHSLFDLILFRIHDVCVFVYLLYSSCENQKLL